MSSRRFYLTLPSNSSMNYYPSNTVARYATKLPQVMELEGDWEVALAEITVPSPLPNVTRDTHFFTLRSTDTDETRVYTLRWGYYDTALKVVTEMNSLTRAHPTGVAFRYQLKRVKLVNNGSYDVEFSDALAHMLGFSAGTRYPPRNVGHSAPPTIDLSSVVVPTLYVYCDILEHVVVGDIMAPLLRIVNMEVTRSHAVHQITNPPLFVPVQKKNFDTIEMNIMTDTGEPVPFMDGKSVVVLEFKRIGLL